MGLDMKLYCNDRHLAEDMAEWRRLNLGVEEPDFENGTFDGRNWEALQIEYGTVICWRKANAIHKWFVDNCQGGNDDCRTVEVDACELDDLYDVLHEIVEHGLEMEERVVMRTVYKKGKKCKEPQTVKVLKDDSVASELLPAQDGSFFGYDADAPYGEWYVEDLKNTHDMLDFLLHTCLRESVAGKPHDRPWRYKYSDDGLCLRFHYESSW